MRWLNRHKSILLVLAAAAVLGAWWRYDHHFTPERWQAADRRDRLVRSLVRQYDLTGMTREGVETLLGPDDEGFQRAAELRPDGGWAVTPMLLYSLGGRPWGLYPDYLELYLEGGRVARVELGWA